ncbi:MAG: hypothetical protein ACT4PW_14670 [Acidimicrobiia bacterium]
MKPVEAAPAPAGPGAESRTKTVIRRVAVTVTVFGCLWGFVIAAQHTRRNDPAPELTGPGAIATILSPRDADPLVNRQAQVSIAVDLRYDAALSINGVAIPADQISELQQQGSVQYLFTPGPGKVLQVLPTGETCARADVFRTDGTPESARVIRWCFRVA